MSVFETKRMRARQLTAADFEPFHEMQANPAVMQYTTGSPQSVATNRAQLQQCIDGYKSPNQDFLVWAIELKQERQFVGTCAVVTNNDDENELGYRFLERYWGKGFGCEILDGLIEYWLRQRQAGSLVAHVDKRNLASVRILENSKMLFEREQLHANGLPELRFTLNALQYREQKDS